MIPLENKQLFLIYTICWRFSELLILQRRLITDWQMNSSPTWPLWPLSVSYMINKHMQCSLYMNFTVRASMEFIFIFIVALIKRYMHVLCSLRTMIWIWIFFDLTFLNVRLQPEEHWNNIKINKSSVWLQTVECAWYFR